MAERAREGLGDNVFFFSYSPKAQGAWFLVKISDLENLI